MESRKSDFTLEISEEIPFFTMEGHLAKINVSSEISLSALTKLNSILFQNGELDLAFVNNIS